MKPQGLGGCIGPVGAVRRGPSPLDPIRRVCRPAGAVDDAGLAAAWVLRLGDRLTRGRRGLRRGARRGDRSAAHAGVALPGGARATMWPTPALVAIDVDGGQSRQALGGGARHEAVNRALLGWMHQIRLRNLSGAILVDLRGPVGAQAVPAIDRDFERALGADPLPPGCSGSPRLAWRRFRERGASALHELLSGSYGRIGLAALRGCPRAHGQDPARAAVRWRPVVVSPLQADPVVRCPTLPGGADAPFVRSDPSLPPAGWVLEKEQMADNGASCPICGRRSSDRVPAVLHAAVRRSRSRPLVDRRLSDSGSPAELDEDPPASPDAA